MVQQSQRPVAWRTRVAPAIVLLVSLVLIGGFAASWAGLLDAATAPWWSYLFLTLLAVAMLALAAAVTIDPRPLPLRRALAGVALVWLVLLGFATLIELGATDPLDLITPMVLGIVLGAALAQLASTTAEVAELDDEDDWFARFGAVVPFGIAILVAAVAAVAVASIAVGVWRAFARGDLLDRLPWGAVVVVVAAPAVTFVLASLDSRRAGAGTFYAQAAANRRDSWLLLITMIGVVAATAEIIAVSLTFDPVPALWAAAVAGLLGAVAAAGTSRFGANVVLEAAGSRPADPVRDATLLNVVSELSTAANVPVPRTYVIEDGSQNAFATGRDPAHASLAVTRGLLERMDREELQGVIGHELGHVRNLDTRYALYVAVLVGLVALVTDGFLRVIIEGWKRGAFFWKGEGKNAGGALVMGLLVGLFLLIVAGLLRLLAPLFSAMVQAATSREREFLADATSVEFTRNPRALERALISIAADSDTLEAANRGTQHLWFRNPVKPGSDRRSGWLSTHPSLGARIDRLRVLEGLEPLGAAAPTSAET